MSDCLFIFILTDICPQIQFDFPGRIVYFLASHKNYCIIFVHMVELAQDSLQEVSYFGQSSPVTGDRPL